MKRILLLFSICCAFPAFAIPGIREALKDPADVTVLRLSGEMNEAALLTKNGARFTALTHVVISGISDSLIAEQDLAAVAACPSVTKLTLENCGVHFLSGAVRMLVSVNEVEIVKCAALDAGQAFSMLAEMPRLKSLGYETNNLDRLPKSFSGLRFLERIAFRNNDLSLADGYALNTSRPEALFTVASTQLGFGASSLTVSYGCYDRATAQVHATVMRDMLQGMVGTSGEMPAPQKATAFDRKHPLVQQPIPGLDVRKNVYTTSAKTGGLIEYPSGTKIFIPANAFVDANGNKITGNVTIDYREFRDPVDIIISGIPMKYDSAGQSGDFESAGMFELNASVNGQEVFLAPGKKVDMEFAVVDTASTYNFYVLDEKDGWKYLEQTGSVEEKAVQPDSIRTNLRVASAAADVFVDRLSRAWRYAPGLGDTTSFDRRYADTNYVYTVKNFSFGKRKSKKEKFRDATRWKMRRVSSEKGTTCFKLTTHIFDNVRYSNNPEMMYYRNVTWMFNEAVDKKTLREMRTTRSGISDMRLTYEGGTTYTLEFKLPSGYRSYSVTPVKMYGRKPVALDEKTCMQRNKGYERTLSRRERSLGNSIRHRVVRHQRWINRITKDSVNIWKALQPKMTDAEKKMSFREWATYAPRSTTMFIRMAQAAPANNQHGAVYQALSLMNFGVYNCDQIRRIDNPQDVFALAYTPDGKRLDASQMFVVNTRRNQAFSYSNWTGKPINIVFGSNDRNKLLVISKDGSLAFADVPAFNAQQQMPDGNTRFITTPISDKPVSAEQLRELMFPAAQE